MHSAPIVYINGYFDTGKLAIAQHLLSLLPHSSSHPPVLIDNHTLIDPVATKYTRDHPEYQSHRKAARTRAFEEHVFAEEMRHRTVIFTDWEATDKSRLGLVEEYRDAARRSGRAFIPVVLTGSTEENVRSVVSVGR
jgi:hypothetical protein